MKSVIFLSVKYNGLWFCGAYFYLYCLTPIFNTYLSTLHGKQLDYFMLLFGLFNFLVGYLAKGDAASTPIYFAFLYSLGHYIRIKNDEGSLRKFSIPKCIYGWMVSTTILFSYAILMWIIVGNTQFCFNYYNPLIYIQGVFIFLVFLKLKISNIRIVNYLASSSFVVYLLSENINTRGYFAQVVQFIFDGRFGNLGYIPFVLFLLFGYIALSFIDKLLGIIYYPINEQNDFFS